MDLTAIKTPYGLLDEATREALKAHGGPYEVFSVRGWSESLGYWNEYQAYRVKPQPPKPREWWLINQIAHATEAKAREFRQQLRNENPVMDFPPIIHVREVTD